MVASGLVLHGAPGPVVAAAHGGAGLQAGMLHLRPEPLQEALLRVPEVRALDLKDGGQAAHVTEEAEEVDDDDDDDEDCSRTTANNRKFLISIPPFLYYL